VADAQNRQARSHPYCSGLSTRSRLPLPYGAERLAEKRARDQAERAAVDEPVIHAEAQAELDAAVTADKAEAGTDADLESGPTRET